MHFDSNGDLGQVNTLALASIKFRVSCVEAFGFKCAHWSYNCFLSLNRIAVIKLGRPSFYYGTSRRRLQYLISWDICCFYFLVFTFLHLKFVGNGNPCRTRSLLRYVLHIKTVYHDGWIMRRPEEFISCWARSKVDAIESGAAVARACASSIIWVLRSCHCAEESVGLVSGCLKIRAVAGAERSKVLLPASLVAKLLNLLSMCSFFQIVGLVLIRTLWDGALSWLVEVRKTVFPRRNIIALLVYKSDVVTSIDNLIHTLPSSLIHRKLMLGLLLDMLFNILLVVSTFRSYAVIAWIFSINLLQHTVFSRFKIVEHPVEVHTVHTIDAHVTWALLHFQIGVYVGPPRSSTLVVAWQPH